jgi:hypothetical protein
LSHVADGCSGTTLEFAEKSADESLRTSSRMVPAVAKANPESSLSHLGLIAPAVLLRPEQPCVGAEVSSETLVY